MTIKTPIRQIGNSKGVILPAGVLKSVGAYSELEMRVEGKQIILEPTTELRKDWFKNVTPESIESTAEEREWDEAVLDDDSEWEWK
jgi:antitoxin MazE